MTDCTWNWRRKRYCALPRWLERLSLPDWCVRPSSPKPTTRTTSPSRRLGKRPGRSPETTSPSWQKSYSHFSKNTSTTGMFTMCAKVLSMRPSTWHRWIILLSSFSCENHPLDQIVTPDDCLVMSSCLHINIYSFWCLQQFLKTILDCSWMCLCLVNSNH